MLLFLLLLLKLGCSSETVGNYVAPKPCAQCPLIYLIIIIIIFYFFLVQLGSIGWGYYTLMWNMMVSLL